MALTDDIMAVKDGIEGKFDSSEFEEMYDCESAADIPGTVLEGFVDGVDSLMKANAIRTYSVNYIGRSEVADGMGVEAYFDVVWEQGGSLMSCPVRFCSAY